MLRYLRLGLIDSEGHAQKMFNRYVYDFHKGLYRRYGSVACIYGILGVCNGIFRISPRVTLMAQDIQLVVSDPKSCNNIVIKYQYIFKETEQFLEYVYCFYLVLLLLPFPACRSAKQVFGPGLFATSGA